MPNVCYKMNIKGMATPSFVSNCIIKKAIVFTNSKVLVNFEFGPFYFVKLVLYEVGAKMIKLSPLFRMITRGYYKNVKFSSHTTCKFTQENNFIVHTLTK